MARLYVLSQTLRYLPSLDDLAREFAVNKRTVRRDLEALEDAGVPVRWRLVERAS